MTPSPKEIAATKTEIARVTQPVLSHIEQFKLITDASQYALADVHLSRIRGAVKAVDDRMKKLLDPINEVRKQTLALKNELLQPLEIADSVIREAMKDYKLKELRQRQEEERRQREEQERLQAEAEAIRKKEEAAKTVKMRERLAAQRLAVQEAVTRVEVTPVLPPVRVAHSTTRTVKKWRVTSFSIVFDAIKAHKIPDSILMIDSGVLDDIFKRAPDTVAQWPGIEVYDDVIIVGERQK